MVTSCAMRWKQVNKFYTSVAIFIYFLTLNGVHNEKKNEGNFPWARRRTWEVTTRTGSRAGAAVILACFKVPVSAVLSEMLERFTTAPPVTPVRVQQKINDWFIHHSINYRLLVGAVISGDKVTVVLIVTHLHVKRIQNDQNRFSHGDFFSSH